MSIADTMQQGGKETPRNGKAGRRFAPPSGSGHLWTHGGHPLEFWRKSGQFIYIFGEAFGDDEVPPPDAECPIKIGITTDPAKRLLSLRQKTPHGVWYDIRWMQNSARLAEKSLHELLNPWRCGFEREWFALPYEVEEWLFDGFADAWEPIAKQDRICGETVHSICTCIIPRYYPAEWLHERVRKIDPGNDGHGAYRIAPNGQAQRPEAE